MLGYIKEDTIDVAVNTAGIYMLNDGIFTLAQSKAIWEGIDDSIAIDFVMTGIGDLFSVGLAELEILRSTTMTEWQKKEALANLKKTQNAYVALWTYKVAASCAAGMAGVMYGPVAGFLVEYVTDMAIQIVDDYQQESLLTCTLGGQGVNFKWMIDPSGYVYDMDTCARLEGVKTTAFWIPCEEPDEEYWNTIPGDNEYGEIWDASEYSQENPLLTDEIGGYAWDVPQGWWRVKYEKEGYETAWSDWMTVLPVQTEVNVGMVPTERPPYSFRFVSSTEDSVSVAATNNTKETVSALYLLAAYDESERMVSCELVCIDLTAAESVSLTITADENDTIATVKAFLLDNASKAPLCSAWTYPMEF